MEKTKNYEKLKKNIEKKHWNNKEDEIIKEFKNEWITEIPSSINLKEIKEFLSKRNFSELFSIIIENPKTWWILNRLSLKFNIGKKDILKKIISINKNNINKNDLIGIFNLWKLNKEIQNDFVNNIMYMLNNVNLEKYNIKWLNNYSIEGNSIILEHNNFFDTNRKLKVFINSKWKFESNYIDNKWNLKKIILSKKDLINIQRYWGLKIKDNYFAILNWKLIESKKYNWDTIDDWKILIWNCNIDNILLLKDINRKIISYITNILFNLMDYKQLSQNIWIKDNKIVFILNKKTVEIIKKMIDKYWDNDVFNCFSNKDDDFLDFSAIKKDIHDDLFKDNNLISLIGWNENEELDLIMFNKFDFNKSWKLDSYKITKYPKLWIFKFLFWKKEDINHYEYLEKWTITDINVYTEKYVYNIFKWLEKNDL